MCATPPPAPRRQFLQFIELRDLYRREGLELYLDHDVRQYLVRDGRRVVAELLSLTHARDWLADLQADLSGGR